MSDPKFIEEHKKVIEIIKMIKNGDDLTKELEDELKKVVGSSKKGIMEYYKPKKEDEKQVFDKSKPSILLTSFVGCKGLSAGFTFIVGANNGSIPQDPNNISDVEISQFLVSMTRTRKQCHIISNKWLVARILMVNMFSHFGKSKFLKWIPEDLINNLGEIDAKAIKGLNETYN